MMRGLVIALLPAVAAAQPNQADEEFKRGKALMAQNKLAEACAAFDKSQQLDPKVSVVLNQANCREKNGQLATARKLFVTAAEQTDRATDPAGVQLHTVALERAAKLGDRVSTLTIDVPAPARVAGLAIKYNAGTIEPIAWNTALQLDGGSYTIEASATDFKPWSKTITLANEKDKQTVTVPALEPIAKPPEETKPVETKPVETKPELHRAIEPPPEPPARWPAYVVGGGGVVMV